MHVVTRKTLFAPCISAETARACDGNTAFLIAPKFRQSTVTYQQLGNQGYQHGTVNHTIQFVNNGVTTNHVESCWSRVKRRLKYVYGSSGDLQWCGLIWTRRNTAYGKVGQLLACLRTGRRFCITCASCTRFRRARLSLSRCCVCH